MSEIARQILYDSLVEKGVLSIGTWQKLMPQPVSWKVVANSADEVVFESRGKIIARIPKGGGVFEGDGQLFAGNVITVRNRNNKGATWDATFVYGNGHVLSVSGGAEKGDVVGSFIMPLPSPWEYSQIVVSKFNLQTTNMFVRNYPE